MRERYPQPLHGARLSLQEASHLRAHSAYERLPFLRETCLPTLSTAMYQFATSFERDLAKAKDKNSNSYLRNHVLFVEGSPGAGKSYITRHSIIPFLESSARRWKTEYGVNVTIQHLHWDDVENILTDRGIISPEAGKPFSKKDLKITGEFMNLLAAYRLKKGVQKFSIDDIHNTLLKPGLLVPQEGETLIDFELRVINTFNQLVNELHLQQQPSILVIEKPGPTALKYSIGWGKQTRHYNSRMIDDVLQGNPESAFWGVDRSQLVIGAVGVVPGPNMNALAAYRDELQKTKSWKEANAIGINERYGIGRFTDEEEWKAARIGASLAVMDVSTNAVRTVVSQMMTAAEDRMVDTPVHQLLPSYLLSTIRGNTDLLRDSRRFFARIETNLSEREQYEWDKLNREIDAAASYFNRSYPLMLWNTCFDLVTGLVMDNNFGKVDIKTIIYNNPDIHPRSLITVPLYHQLKLF